MENKIHFYNLDVLRFICAIAVAFAHGYEAYLGWLGIPSFLQNNPSLKPLLDVFMGNLALGVNMFFVISGFLITYLLLAEKQKFGNVHIGRFIIRRSIRIWPLYYFAILVGYFLIRYLNMSPPNYLSNILFWNNFHAIKTLQWQFPFAHFWSICVEEHFYLLWPIIVYFTPVRRLLPVIISLILGSIAFRYFSLEWVQPQKAQFTIYLHTLSRIDEILIGAILGYVHFAKPIVIKMNLWIRLLVYSLFFVVVCYQPQVDFWVWGIYSVLFKKYIYMAFIVFWLCNYLFNPGAIFNFRNKNVLHYLGKISFGIYIYHNMILPLYIKEFVYRWELTNVPLYFGCYIVFLLLISIISFELFEKFFLKLKDKFALIKTQR